MTRPSSSRQGERGVALLIVLSLVFLAALVGLAIASRTANDMSSSGGKRRYDATVSCADGARDLLISQFRTFGLMPTQLTLDRQVGDKRYKTGHYDSAIGVQVTSVTPAAGSATTTNGTGGGQQNYTNTITGTMTAGGSGAALAGALGGQLYRFTVVCTDANSLAHQSEVEYLVRFGL